MAMTLADWGFPRMAARVLIAMMSADEPSLSAADLGERLGVSAAAVSGAVRYLVQMGLLAREPDPGSRRDRYRLPDNVWYEASVIKGGLLKAVADLANSGVDALGGAATPSGARIAEMRDFFVFIQVELDDMLAKWRASKAATPQNALPPTLALGPDQ
jgi:predicted transcriptional regulator